MPTYPTPGVYVAEENAFPTCVVAVATAIPAFIGHTARASHQGRALGGIPTRVESLAEFQAYFGGDCQPVFDLVAGPGAAPGAPLQVAAGSVVLAGQPVALVPDGRSLYYLYRAIRLFYLNGGATCYIVSIGGYDQTASQLQDFLTAIDALVYEPDPTLVLCPDALRLAGPDEYHAVLQHVLAHCASVQSRVALFDVWAGASSSAAAWHQPGSPVAAFRAGVGTSFLNYGIAYFPWVHAAVVAVADLGPGNLTGAALARLQGPPGSAGGALLGQSAAYQAVLAAVAHYLNVLPVAPALAGVYTAVDSSRGVWKAPANVGLNAVVAPTAVLSDNDQAGLSLDPTTGKSINVIRTFPGRGVLVWGARTLDGNSQEWRYVSVRRTLIMLEQSIKLAMHAYVFEPNNATTWTAIQNMINSFLFGLWQQGALAGTVPDDAYAVLVGLGSTMTADNILDGRLNVTVLVAPTRPAEFIELTFQQQMQKS